MSTPSRFNRTHTSEPDQSSGSTEKDHELSSLGMDSKHLQTLQERLAKVQRERVQREVELEATKKTLQECEEAAKKMGIHSLDEMEAYVQRLEAEDIAAQEKFEQQLQSEEALLQKIAQQLADLERE